MTVHGLIHPLPIFLGASSLGAACEIAGQVTLRTLDGLLTSRRST
jgi:hypothetical protein